MILSDFDYGRSLHDTQHFHLGQEVYDSQGNRWGYVQINEASGGAHRLLRSTKHSDIMTHDSGAEGEVNTDIAKGSDRLKVADEANADFTPSTAGPLVGAQGIITAGAGRGQRFWIKRVVDDQEVVVEVLGNDTGKWDTALADTSRFYLWFPGLARQGDGFDDFVEGVLHVDAKTADKGKYAYVQRSGLGLITIHNGGTALGQGKSIVPTSAGRVQGLHDTPNEEQIAAVIGRALSDTSEGSADVQVLASFDIPAPGVSFAGARTQNPYNRVEIGSN